MKDNGNRFMRGDLVRLTKNALRELDKANPGVYNSGTYRVINPCTAAGYVEVVPERARRLLLTEDEIVEDWR